MVAWFAMYLSIHMTGALPEVTVPECYDWTQGWLTAIKLNQTKLELPPAKAGDAFFPDGTHLLATQGLLVSQRAGLNQLPTRATAIQGNWVQFAARDVRPFEGSGYVWVYRQHIFLAEEVLAHDANRIANKPDEPIAYISRAIVYNKTGRYDLALADWDKVVELDPRPSNFFARGNLKLYQMERPADAILDFDLCILKGPRHAPYWNARGTAHARLRHSEQAIADYTQAITVDPKYAAAVRERSLVHYRDFHDDLALADINEALWLQPEAARSYYLRGQYHLTAKRYADSVADLTVAVQKEPENAAYWNLRANAYRQLHQEEPARTDFLKTLQLDPNLVDARKNLSWQLATCEDARFRDGRLAVEHAQAACELTSWKDISCLKGLAAAYAECGDFERAIEMQQRAVAGVDEMRRAHYQAKLDQLLRREPIREDPIATMAVGAGKR